MLGKWFRKLLGRGGGGSTNALLQSENCPFSRTENAGNAKIAADCFETKGVASHNTIW